MFRDLHEDITELFLDAQSTVFDSVRAAWSDRYVREVEARRERYTDERVAARRNTYQQTRYLDWKERNPEAYRVIQDRHNARRRAKRVAAKCAL